MVERTTAPCGDRIERDGDVLVIHAAFPIERLEVSRFRNPVLVMDALRFTLTAVEGSASRPIYKFVVEAPNLYAPGGQEIHYDGDRHIERRQQRRRLALAWILWLPTVPLLPLIGLLPESTKQKLVALGVNPGRATRLSLALEWLLLFVLILSYVFSGGFFTPLGAIIGALTLLTGLDICYRVTSDADNRAPGAFGIVGELVRFIKAMLASDHKEDRLLGDDDKKDP